jgi:hypothetical protein
MPDDGTPTPKPRRPYRLSENDRRFLRFGSVKTKTKNNRTRCRTRSTLRASLRMERNRDDID